jgi:hypothetical protein
LTEPLEHALASRLREVLRRDSASERELRLLGEQADGWARALQGQIHASEQRLQRLNADPASPLAEIAGELRLLDSLRAETVELDSLASQLDQRAHALRAEWLARQAAAPRGAGSD